MRKRLITGLLLLLIIGPITVINDPMALMFFQLLMIIFVVLSTFEMISMFEKKKKMPTSVKIITLVLTLIMFFNVAFQGIMHQNSSNPTLFSLDINNIAIIAFSTTLLLCLFVLVKDFDFLDVGKVLLIVNYVGIGAAAILLLRFLGVRFIVYVALIGVLTDSFALFIGIPFGKHKMVPSISPKKSWEGAIAGTIVATVFASLFAIFYGVIFSPDGWLGSMFNPSGYVTIFDNFTSLGDEPLWLQGLLIVPITFLGSVVSQIGDLAASKMKRTYEIKDFSKILPGHGGILDRFDSVLLTSLFLISVFLMIAQSFPLI